MAFTYKNNNVNIVNYKGNTVNILQYQGVEVWRRSYTVTLLGANSAWTYGGQTVSSIKVPYGSTISKSSTVGEFIITIPPNNTTSILKSTSTFPAGTPYVTNWDSITPLTIYADSSFEFYHSDGYALELKSNLGYSYLSNGLAGYKVLPGDNIGISGNNITITRNGSTVKTGSVNALANTTATSSNTTGYTYGVTVTSTSRVVNSAIDATIEAVDTRADNSYWLAIKASHPEYTTLSSTGLAVPVNAELTVSSNTITVAGTTVTATPAADTDATASNTTGYIYKFNNWDIDGNIINSAITITAPTVINAFVIRTKRYWVAFNVNNETYGSADRSGFAVNVGAQIAIYNNTVSIGNTNAETVTFTKSADIACTADNTTGYIYSFVDITKSKNITSVSEPITFTGNFNRTTYYWVSVSNVDTTYGTVSGGGIAFEAGLPVYTDSNVLRLGTTTYTATPASTITCSASQTTGIQNCALSSWGISNGTVITAPTTITASFTGNTCYWVTVAISGNGTWSTTPAETGIPVKAGQTFTVSDTTLKINKLNSDGTQTQQTYTVKALSSYTGSTSSSDDKNQSSGIWTRNYSTPVYTPTFSNWNVSNGAAVNGPTNVSATFNSPHTSTNTSSEVIGYAVKLINSMGKAEGTYAGSHVSVSALGQLYLYDSNKSKVADRLSAGTTYYWVTKSATLYVRGRTLLKQGVNNSGATIYSSITAPITWPSTEGGSGYSGGGDVVLYKYPSTSDYSDYKSLYIDRPMAIELATATYGDTIMEASGASASGKIGRSSSLTASWSRTLTRTTGYATIQVYYRGKGGNSFKSNNGSGIASGTTKVSYSSSSYMNVSGISWTTSGITVSGTKGTAVSYSWSISNGAAYPFRV